MILEQLTDRISAAIWNLHPGWAVAVGRHEYDGQVPDLSAEAIEAGLERLGRLREQLVGLAGLAPDQGVDREVLLGVVDREHLDLERVARWRRDPSWYLEPLDISVYLERDYAPAGLRLERAASVLGEAGSLLSAARANLGAAIPRLWVESARERARDLAGRLVAQVEWAPAAGTVPGEAAWLREAAAFAAAELGASAAWLEGERLPGAAGDFSVGAEGLEEWLRASEGVRCQEERRGAWHARLREDQRALADDAARLAPGLSIDQACRRAAAAAAESAPVAVRRALQEARRRAARLGLPAPGADPAVVAALGGTGEGEAGWLQAPGPYDDPATRAGLLIVPGASAPAIDALVVTELMPGRLQAERNAAEAIGEARRRFPSGGFRDGWALFAGDLMEEAGFREDAPGWRLLWRRRVVLAGCRLALGADLHCGAVSFEQAGQGFTEEAGLSPAAARVEAQRCARDLNSLLGALGRLELIGARLRWEGPSLAGFYSGLLSGAALPLGMLDRLLP